MLDFDKRPFNRLPFNQGDLLDMTCDYLISLFERINTDYHQIVYQATELTRHFTDPSYDVDFVLLKNFFATTDRIIDTYSKLVRCSKLSLGQPVGKVKSKHTVFQTFSYTPDSILQTLVIYGLRNTQQHFEERLQDFHSQLDPFIQMVYRGSNTQWEISFGIKGIRFGSKTNGTDEIFDITKLIFHSYCQLQDKKKLQPASISIGDVWKDTLQMIKLTEENMEAQLLKNGDSHCSRFTYFGVYVTPGSQ